MKITFSAATFLFVALSGVAFAQPPAVNWAGPYVGASAGLSMAGNHIDTFNELVEQFSGPFIPGRGIVIVPGTTSPFPASDFGGTKFVGGGQAGYAFALDNWVLGAEGDFGVGGQSSTVTATGNIPATAIEPASNVTFTRSVSSNVNWSIRARAGYAWDNFLLYGTAGLAGSHFKVSGFDTYNNPGGLSASCAPAPCQSTSTAVTNTTNGSLASSRLGWTAGGGGEIALGGGFSIGLEFRHNDYGNQVFALPTNNVSVTVPTVTTAGASTNGALPPRVDLGATPINFMDDTFTVRLNFHL